MFLEVYIRAVSIYILGYPQAHILDIMMSNKGFKKGNTMNLLRRSSLAPVDNESGAAPRVARRAEGITMFHCYHIVTRTVTLLLLHSFRT